MFQENDKVLLIIFSIILLVPLSMVVLFVVFNNRKNKLIQQQLMDKKKFETELAETQIEIREETLRNISWELHDNIGQLVTLAKIQLQNSQNDPDKLKESTKILGDALRELRALSKSINPESLKNMNLLEAVNNEIERFDRMNFIHSDFQITGNPFEIPQKEEIIIFRILQEFFTNTIRHSRATELNVNIIYKSNELEIHTKDNGVGFDPTDNFKGIGLRNMKTRAQLINAKITLNSTKDQGTELIIQKKFIENN